MNFILFLIVKMTSACHKSTNEGTEGGKKMKKVVPNRVTKNLSFPTGCHLQMGS